MSRHKRRGQNTNGHPINHKATAAPPLRRLSSSSTKSKRHTAKLFRTIIFLGIYVSLVLYGAILVGYSNKDQVERTVCPPRQSGEQQQPQTPAPAAADPALKKKNILSKTKMWLAKLVDKKKKSKKQAELVQPDGIRDTEYIVEIDDDTHDADRRTEDSAAVSKVEEQPQTEEMVSADTLADSPYPAAFSQPREISDAEVKLMQEFSRRVLALAPNDDKFKNIMEQLSSVPWAGSVAWFDPVKTGKNDDALDAIAGGRLLYAYYRIMRTHMKDSQDLSQGVNFPFRLAQQLGNKKGLSAEQSVAHTLQWRQIYRPFQVTPSVITENAQGFCYHRGLAKTPPHSPGAHAMIWTRPGVHKAKDPLAYFRIVLNAADRAVADSLTASNGKNGKFNVVIDAAGYSWGSIPAIQYVKQTVTMLQDHYPDRLGAVFLVHFSRTAEFCINLIKPLLTKEVREKLYILPHDPKKLLEALESVVDRRHIPKWLGGDDNYAFDVESYYPKSMRMTEEQGKDFMTAMPYHA